MFNKFYEFGGKKIDDVSIYDTIEQNLEHSDNSSCRRKI